MLRDSGLHFVRYICGCGACRTDFLFFFFKLKRKRAKSGCNLGNSEFSFHTSAKLKIETIQSFSYQSSIKMKLTDTLCCWPLWQN